MSYPNQDLTLHETHGFNRNCEYCSGSLQVMLDNLKDKKLPNKTLFGDLNSLVPRQYSKFENMDNPPL